ncbi:MAG TPA: ASKHA domain-containing protein, partial [Terriglobales bacterium]
MFPIRFLPEDRTYQAEQPVDLMLAAAACDIWVEQPCGSKTICGKCKVRVREGDAALSLGDQRLLSPEELRDGWRLGCQLVLSGASVIEIPPATRSVAAKPFGPADLFAGGFQPNIIKRYLELRPPDEDNQYASFDIISRALGSPRLRAEMTMVQKAVQRLTDNDYKVSVVVGGDELLAIEAGNTADSAYGVAIDIGSTTLGAALVNLHNGSVVCAMSRLNPQVKFGADIISRIHYVQEHKGGSEQLHKALISALRQMIEELATQGSVSPSDIYSVVCAGNATMTHSAVGADTTPLGQAPYVGLWTREWTVRAREFELPVSKRALVRFMPMIRSHVGGDTVSAALACGLDRSDGWQAMIDLGTNSEVVVGNRHRMVATSTAAGPAFEGANIHHGMRAAPGAIDQVRISPDGRIVVKTVNNEAARGICGTGLVDAAAELVRMGVIAPSGYMKKGEELAGVPKALRERCFKMTDGQSAVRLAEEVILTAQDVRQLQLIKGSIYAGLDILLQHLGIGLD